MEVCNYTKDGSAIMILSGGGALVPLIYGLWPHAIGSQRAHSALASMYTLMMTYALIARRIVAQ